MEMVNYFPHKLRIKQPSFFIPNCLNCIQLILVLDPAIWRCGGGRMARVYFLSVSFIEKNHLMKYIMYFKN